MSSAREQLEAYWTRILFEDGYTYLWPNDEPFEDVCAVFESEQSALKYTEQHREEVRQLEEEIRFAQIVLRHQHDACGDEGCGCEEPFKRILQRLEAALAEKLRGTRKETK